MIGGFDLELSPLHGYMADSSIIYGHYRLLARTPDIPFQDFEPISHCKIPDFNTTTIIYFVILRYDHWLANRDMINEHNERYAEGLETYRMELSSFSDQVWSLYLTDYCLF